MEINTEHKAVFSWRTKPWLLWNYTSMKFHLASWIIAIEFAKKIYPKVEIYTDKKWKELLSKFWYECSDELEQLELHPWFRAWGKLLTYSLQREPFTHIDSDCFLWKPLPQEFQECNLFTQNEENDDWFKSAYQGQIDYMMKNNFLLPEYVRNTSIKKASCCGIIWWQDFSFINWYANEALDIIRKNKDKRIWMDDVWIYNVIFEQWLLDVIVNEKNKQMKYLTYPWIDKDELTRMWYQHLWWAKKEKKTEQLVLEFCKEEFPILYSILQKTW